MSYLMTHGGKLYDLDDAFEFLKAYQVIFVGEEHESRVSHNAELTLLKGLSELDPNPVVMAASVEPFLDHRILFCCGHFHSDYHLGIPYQLQKNHRELKIAVIAFASYVGNLPMKERSRVGDFIWVEE